MTRIKLVRESAWRAREESVSWLELPARRYVRMADSSVWYVEGFQETEAGRIVKMHATYGGQVYTGPVPENVDARRIIRHDDEDLDAMKSGRPWKLSALPHGVNGNRRHLLDFHGAYMETTLSWQEMTRVHLEMHHEMNSGNGLTLHTHREAPQIVWE